MFRSSTRIWDCPLKSSEVLYPECKPAGMDGEERTGYLGGRGSAKWDVRLTNNVSHLSSKEGNECRNDVNNVAANEVISVKMKILNDWRRGRFLVRCCHLQVKGGMTLQLFWLISEEMSDFTLLVLLFQIIKALKKYLIYIFC